MGQIQWINSAGGPLLLVAQEDLESWHGIENDDYDRACAVDDYVGMIPVGGGPGLVLGDEPMQTAWVALTASSGLLVRWMWADSEQAVIDSLPAIPEEAWQATGINFPSETGNFILIDSGAPGQKVREYLRFTLEPGDYIVETAEYSPQKSLRLVVHRIRME